MFKKACERLALDKLHRIEVVLAGSAQVKDGGNIRMTNARRRPGLAQKPQPRRLLPEIFSPDNLQCHLAAQVDIDGFVGNTHGAPA